ncbi:MAG: L,D-transpeptidase [Parachlamydiaceae bacterium]|nr:L,D-transpeptidase [Parachlamydiaceae bacterium]
MTLPKMIAIFSILLFGLIGVSALFKNNSTETIVQAPVETALEIELDHQIQTLAQISPTEEKISPLLNSYSANETIEKHQEKPEVKTTSPYANNYVELPQTNRINEFFNVDSPKFPIVETLTYTSTVTWLKGRPAWVTDYANHYETSRHFIARSLRGKPDYNNQQIAKGDRFNVLRKDKNIEFYLLVDASRCKLLFYYIDVDLKKKVLIKTYDVGLGRLDSSKTSGLLTPLGKYLLGNRVAVHTPKMMGNYQGKKTELVTVFGTRWIPFEKEIGICSAPAKGFGLHGTPWSKNSDGELCDRSTGIGKYESDGCIRMSTADIEEIYAIIITKPTTVEIVKDFHDSSLADMAEN